jgi:DNA-binding transcriptional MerR regulator
MSFTVGQLAKLSGLSVRSLHHYDEIGLLSPSERSEAGYRLYSERDLERLNQIQGLRWLELPLEDVKEVLDRGGAAIPEVVNQKIDALTMQIEAATELRARLENLRAQLLGGQIAGTEQLLAAVELYKHYEKHLSGDDLNRFNLQSEADKGAWRNAYNDAASALERNVSPASDEAQEIAYRWGVLNYKHSNGDMSVMLKTKAAYESDAGVRRSMSAVTKTDPAVIQFVLAASNHQHLRILSQYFAPEELARLNMATQWNSEWLRVAAALREHCAKQSPVDCEIVRGLTDEWFGHVDAITVGDQALKDKFLAALRCDVGLQKRWLASEALLNFAQQAQQAKPRTARNQ